MIAMFKRDIRLTLRSGGGFALSLAFYLLLVMLVPFGIGPNPEVLARIAPGIIWIGAILTCLLSLDRIFQLDFDDGSLDMLITSPVPLEATVAVKALAHWVSTGLPLTVIAPLLGYLLYFPTEGYLWLMAGMFAGTPALSYLGAFGAALTVGVKRGGLLLSLLTLPLYIPTLIIGAQLIFQALQGQDPQGALFILAGLSLLSIATMPFVTAATLRFSLR